VLVPIGDENAGRRLTPFVNYTLIAVNVAVFLLQLLVGGLSAAFFVAWGVQPVEVVAFQEWQTVLTSMFLHGGLWHLIGNMLFLHVFGDNIEDAMGHARYLIFYLLCGAAAAFAQVATDPFSAVPIVGASGAVSGVLGAYIVLFPQGRIRSLLFLGIFGTVVMVPAWAQLGLWFAIQLVLGVLALGARRGAASPFSPTSADSSPGCSWSGSSPTGARWPTSARSGPIPAPPGRPAKEFRSNATPRS
jgi:membrane associated rhomboid family serine protease